MPIDIRFFRYLPSYGDWSQLDLGTFEIFLTNTTIAFVALLLDVLSMNQLLIHNGQ